MGELRDALAERVRVRAVLRDEGGASERLALCLARTGGVHRGLPLRAGRGLPLRLDAALERVRALLADPVELVERLAAVRRREADAAHATDAFKDIEKIESDLWEAADNLRANSKLTSSAYFRSNGYRCRASQADSRATMRCTRTRIASSICSCFAASSVNSCR